MTGAVQGSSVYRYVHIAQLPRLDRKPGETAGRMRKEMGFGQLRVKSGMEITQNIRKLFDQYVIS